MAKLTLSACLDAGHVRLAELGTALLAALSLDNEPEAARLSEAALHLRLSLESAARLPKDSPDQDALLAYLCETFGLRRALLDPLLRPLLPVVGSGGQTTIQRKVLAGPTGTFLSFYGRPATTGAVLTTAPLL